MSKHGGQVPESPQEIAQAGIASKLMQRYESAWVPMQNFFMGRVDSMRSKGDQDIGRATAEAKDQFSKQEPNLTAALGSRNVASGPKFASAMAGHIMNEGAAATGAGETARDVVEHNYIKGLSDIVSTGENVASTASGGAGMAAGLGQRQASASAEIQREEQAALGESVGTGVGLMTALKGVNFGNQSPTTSAPQANQPAAAGAN